MGTEQNKAIVGQFFERFSAADVPGALELLDDGAVWHVMGREGGLPLSGEMDKRGVGELIRSVKEAIPEGLQLTPTGWTAEGQRVAVEMDSYGALTNGKVYRNRYHFLAIVAEEKITQLKEYMDTYHAKLVFVDE